MNTSKKKGGKIATITFIIYTAREWKTRTAILTMIYIYGYKNVQLGKKCWFLFCIDH